MFHGFIFVHLKSKTVVNDPVVCNDEYLCSKAFQDKIGNIISENIVFLKTFENNLKFILSGDIDGFIL